MGFRGIIYNSLQSWEGANVLAHNICKNSTKYNSKDYQKKPIITIDNKFILIELKGFESELKSFGFEEIEKRVIKKEIHEG